MRWLQARRAGKSATASQRCGHRSRREPACLAGPCSAASAGNSPTSNTWRRLLPAAACLLTSRWRWWRTWGSPAPCSEGSGTGLGPVAASTRRPGIYFSGPGSWRQLAPPLCRRRAAPHGWSGANPAARATHQLVGLAQACKVGACAHCCRERLRLLPLLGGVGVHHPQRGIGVHIRHGLRLEGATPIQLLLKQRQLLLGRQVNALRRACRSGAPAAHG